MTAHPKWFAHANVNCEQLGPSEAFYSTVLGLTPRWRTAPSYTQDGTGFGMPGVGVQWEGAILTDQRGLRGPAVDLLRWISPPTVGVPPAEPHHLGFVALRFTCAALDRLVDRLQEAGTPFERVAARDDRGGVEPFVRAVEPGGVTVEFTEGDTGDAGEVRFGGVRANCADFARSLAWYREVVGLRNDDPRMLDVLGDDADGADAVGRLETVDLYVPGRRDGFRVALTEWHDPVPVGAPPPFGNATGIYRIALTVDDIDDGWADLAASMPDPPPVVTVDLGETLGTMRAVFFPDPDGAIVELLERGLR